MCACPDFGGSSSSSRRGFLFKLGLALNVLGAALVGVPVIGYILAPARRLGGQAWIKLDGVALRGYRRESFSEAWTRYLPLEMEPTPTDGTPQVAPTSTVPSVAMGSVLEEGPCVRCARYGPDHTDEHIDAWGAAG